MSTFLKVSISLITLGGASVGGYILSNNYNDDIPIYGITQAKPSLSHTEETFRKGSLGNIFPRFFLSTRAVKNDELWKAKKARAKEDKSKWTKDSFFSDVIKDEDDATFVIKVKASCMKAYKTIPNVSTSNGDFLVTQDKWREVWLMCGRLTT